MSSTIDQQFIEFVVKSLVGKPDKVIVERRIDEKGVLLELTVDPEDLGRVIGKRGATAQSLRTLLRALGTKNDARYNLKIVDNGEPHERRPRDDDSYKKVDSRSDSNDEQSYESSIENLVSDKETEEKDAEVEEDHSSVVSKTRKELDDLDDLDI